MDGDHDFQRWRHRTDLTREVRHRVNECPKCGETHPVFRQKSRSTIECYLCGFQITVGSSLSDWIIYAFLLGVGVGAIIIGVSLL